MELFNTLMALTIGVLIFLRSQGVDIWKKIKGEGVVKQIEVEQLSHEITEALGLSPTINKVTKLPTAKVSRQPTKAVPRPTEDGTPWGISRQIGEHTWTMKVGQDERMSSPSELLAALNDYRRRAGAQPLAWDEKLAEYARSRVDYFVREGKMDEHKGFENFLDNENGFEKLGYNWLGENTSMGYRMEGVHLIEWIFAGDKPHDDNQKDGKWDHVGIGIRDTSVCLIFATGKR